MWLSDSTVWHRLALGRHLIEACGSRPGAPRGQSAGVLAPSGGCAVWKEARGRAPVPTKCCLSFRTRSRRSRQQGSREQQRGRRQNPRDTQETHGQRNGKAANTCPAAAWAFLMCLVPGTTQPRGCPWPLGKDFASLPQADSGQGDRTSGRRASSGRRGFGDKCGDGRAGMSGGGGVSRQSWDGGQCRGVLLPTGLAGLPVLSQEPLHQGWALTPHWVRSW